MASSFASERGTSGTACENPAGMVGGEQKIEGSYIKIPSTTFSKHFYKTHLWVNDILTIFLSVLSCFVQAVLQPQHGSRQA